MGQAVLKVVDGEEVVVTEEKPDDPVNLDWIRRETPELPNNFNTEKSITKVRAVFYRWRDLTEEILDELWIAREVLSMTPSERAKKMHGTIVSSMGWGEYCEKIGIVKRTANRWLKRAFGGDTDNKPVKIAKKYYESVNKVLGKADNVHVVPWGGKTKTIPMKGNIFISVGHDVKQAIIDQLRKKLELKSNNIGEVLIHINKPATHTDRFQFMCKRGAFCFIDGQLEYEKGAESGACFVYIGKNEKKFCNEFKKHGSVLVPYKERKK